MEAKITINLQDKSFPWNILAESEGGLSIVYLIAPFSESQIVEGMLHLDYEGHMAYLKHDGLVYKQTYSEEVN